MNRRQFLGVLAGSIISGALLHSCSGVKTNKTTRRVKSWALQLQNAEPDLIAKSGFELVVIDYSRDGSEEGRYTKEEIKRIKASGIVPIAYLSIGEAEDYRFYWRDGWYSNPPEWLGRENPEWKGNYAVKYWHKEWKTILHTYLDKIIEQGFLGVYLDRVDVFEYWADPKNGEKEYLSEEVTANRMIELITDISQHSRSRAGREFYVIPQNGERILAYDESLINTVSGWGAEDIFYNGTQEYGPEDMSWIFKNRIAYLDLLVSKGKLVLSVDYVDDGSGYVGANKRRIDDYRKNTLKRGYIPYAALSDRALDKLNIIKGVQP